MSTGSVLPLSSDTVTDGVEVSLFHNPALLFSCFFESCSDERLRLLAAADARRAGRQQAALSALQHTQPEAAVRLEEEERSIDDMIALADSTADLHLPNRPCDAPPVDLARAGCASPPIPALLYASLQQKRAQVLHALHAVTRADIEHFHRRHSSRNAAATSAADRTTLSAASTAAHRPLSAFSSSNSAVPSSLSSVPPLLRWSLLSMFPLIDSVSRVDPSLRVHTVRLLVGVLQSSPPLSLFHEDDSTIALVQSQLTGAAVSSMSSEAVSDMHSARIGLAVQRGRLRHILAALEPLITGPEDDTAHVDIQPYLTTLQQYAASKPLLSALTEDTLMSQWRHHAVAQPHTQPQPEPATAVYARSSVAPPSMPAALTTEFASADSAATLMASYTTPLLGTPTQREANDAAALDLFSPPAATSTTPPTTSPISMPHTADASNTQPSTSLPTASSTIITVSRPSVAPSPCLPSYGCLSSDGVFHYVYSQRGLLLKLGSGCGGSLQGHVYGSTREPFAALLPRLPPSLSTVLSSESCHHAYGGWLIHLRGSLLFRSSLFILAQPELLAIRIDTAAQTLSAVELVWADSASYEQVRDDSSRGSVRWFQTVTDGEHLLILREQHRDRHCFYIDRFAPATHSAVPPPSVAAIASTVRSSCMRLLSSTLLPCGFTQFPSAHRYTRSLSSLLSPYHFHVGQKVDAKDSINKCQHAQRAYTREHVSMQLHSLAQHSTCSCACCCRVRPHSHIHTPLVRSTRLQLQLRPLFQPMLNWVNSCTAMVHRRWRKLGHRSSPSDPPVLLSVMSGAPL